MAAIAGTGCQSCAPKIKPAPPAPPSLGGDLYDDEEPEHGSGWGYEAPITPYTEDALLIEYHHGWIATKVKVPAMSGGIADVCFKIKNIRAWQCFYKSLEGDRIEAKWVMPQREDL